MLTNCNVQRQRLITGVLISDKATRGRQPAGRHTSVQEAPGAKTGKQSKQGKQAKAQSTKPMPKKGGRIRRRGAASREMEDYIELLSNPIEYIASGRDVPRNPNSAGTPTFVGSFVSTFTHEANAPYYDDSGLVADKNAAVFIATNGVSTERFLRSAPAEVTGITQMEGKFVTQVVNETAVSGDETFGTNNNNYAEGVLSANTNASVKENYVASLPSLYGSPCWLINWSAVADTTVTATFRCPSYSGNVQFVLQRYIAASQTWTNIGTANLKGSTTATTSATLGASNLVAALRICVISNAQQELAWEVNIYVGNTSGSFTIPWHMNSLVPIKGQFQEAIDSGLIREYWPVAAGEIITNTTNALDMEGNNYSVSTQRFAGLYNVTAPSMEELITANKIHFYAGAAAQGMAGHSVPRAVMSEPLPFHFRGFASDCRIYLSISKKVQTYNIRVGTAICALGKRTGYVEYGVTSYPPWWCTVIEALVYLNPMSCNPGHKELFGKAYSMVKQFISNPENVGKLIDGTIKAAELANFALESSLPRVAGGANQVATALKFIR